MNAHVVRQASDGGLWRGCRTLNPRNPDGVLCPAGLPRTLVLTARGERALLEGSLDRIRSKHASGGWHLTSAPQ